MAAAEAGPPPKGTPAPGPPVATWGSSPGPPAAPPPPPRPSPAAALPAAERQGVERNDTSFRTLATGLSDSVLLAAYPLHMSQATAELSTCTFQGEKALRADQPASSVPPAAVGCPARPMRLLYASRSADASDFFSTCTRKRQSCCLAAGLRCVFHVLQWCMLQVLQWQSGTSIS